MSTLPIKPLDGERGYLLWKESVLLRLRTLGLAAHVLLSDEKSPGGDEIQYWAHDDALCRGHILVTLSDRLIPVYAHHATAGALWDAVTRTYDDVTFSSSGNAFGFRYKEGQPVREQLALLQAFSTAANLSDRDVADIVAGAGFPRWMSMEVGMHRSTVCMDDLWDIARKQVMGEAAVKGRRQRRS